MRASAFILAFSLSVPAGAQRVVAPVLAPVLPGAGIPAVAPLAPSLAAPSSLSAAPSPMPTLAAPTPTTALPKAAAAPGVSVPAAAAGLALPQAAASAVLPEDAGRPRPRAWKAVPAALKDLGRAAFSSVFSTLGKAFDGSLTRFGVPVPDPRPAPPVPSDPADRVGFNGLALPRRAFSDQSRISMALVSVIDASRETLDIAIHGLAIREVGEALSRAKARGVKVRIVMNEGHAWPQRPGERRTPEVQRLLDEGFEMRTLRGSREHGIMHNKFLVADGKLLMAGSYNWTRAADTMNLENVFFTDDPRRVSGFQGYWGWMWSQSRSASEQPPSDKEGPEPRGAPPEDPARPIRFGGEAFPSYAFAPRGTPEAWLVKAVGLSKLGVSVAMFSFTSPRLRDALTAARDRGVKVRLLFDQSQAGMLESMRWFAENGFDVRLRAGRDGRKGVLHNKFTVIDGVFVETGSYNWTENADKNNYENAVFFDDAGSARDYGAAFERLWAGGRTLTAAEWAALATAGAPPAP